MKGSIILPAIVIAALVIVAGVSVLGPSPTVQVEAGFTKFSSCEDLSQTMEEFSSNVQKWGYAAPTAMRGEVLEAAGSDSGTTSQVSYSETNIQVEGVDEADIVKTDGNYIYAVAGNKLFIVKAYPTEEARILSETDLGEYNPSELFIHDGTLLTFGYTSEEYVPESNGDEDDEPGAEKMIYPYYRTYTTVKLCDISEKDNPDEVRTIDFEGNYVSSRKIGEHV